MRRDDSHGTGLTRRPCRAGATAAAASQQESCLSFRVQQMSPVYNKGRDWVESITKIHTYLQPELFHSFQPVAEMAALLLMSRRQIMQKPGENMTFRKSNEQ